MVPKAVLSLVGCLMVVWKKLEKLSSRMADGTSAMPWSSIRFTCALKSMCMGQFCRSFDFRIGYISSGLYRVPCVTLGRSFVCARIKKHSIDRSRVHPRSKFALQH